MKINSNPRISWLWLYISINIVAGIIMLSTGELIGDVRGGGVYDRGVLIFATIIVSASYFLILSPLFFLFDRVNVKRALFHLNETNVNNLLGLVIIFLQILYFVFNYTYGVNFAGSSKTTDSSLAIFWVLFPIDAIFLIFYGSARDSKYFKVNAIFYFFSNFFRGWAGVILIFVFMEWCRVYRGGKMKFSRILLVFIIALILYPFVNWLKFYIRISHGVFSWVDFIDSIQNFSDADNFFEVIYIGVMHLVERIQTVSILVEVIRLRDVLSDAFSQGIFIPFWYEGLHGIIFDRIFGAEKGIPLGVAFTMFADFNWIFNIGDWNTNTSYPSWFFIAPYLFPVYIIYTLFLCFLSMVLMKKISSKESAMDMLWVAWLFYLLPPWFGTFVQLIYALFVFLCMKFFLFQIKFANTK